jgi:diguanylate cyclase (GGDEF)-like protein
VSRPRTPHDLELFAVLTACALVSVEGSRRLGSPTTRVDKPYKDMLSAWTLPVALLLPPLYAVLFPLPVYWAVQRRVTRIAPVKRVFNGASVALAGVLAGLTRRALSGTRGAPRPQDLLDTPRAAAATVVAALVLSAVSACLVAVVVRLVAPATTWRTALAGWPLQATEAAELCLGLLVALACAHRPLLAVLGLPPLLLLQRTLLHSELLQSARTDSKTGLATPRHWREVAEREVARARRGAAPLAVLLVDIDHFKRVNDAHGHLVGDQVLAAVAGTLQAAVRPSDLVGRFGGEEFVLLLPDSTPVGALGTAERVRALVEQLAHPVSASAPPVVVTVSVGVASLGTAAHDLTGLLEQADAALLRAKADGRDRVRVAPALPLEPLTARR